MSVLHLAIGVGMLAVGTFQVAGRHRIVQNHVRRRGRAQVPAGAWLALGSLFLLAGALQIVAAFV